MLINLDFTQLSEMTTLPLPDIVWRLMFWYFGWLPIAVVSIWGALQLWLYYRQNLYAAKQKTIVLAIDIPQNNVQSLRAVENLFAYIHGAQKTPNLIEKWWEGLYQPSFSFEIVAIDGYIQFLVVAPAQFKDFVETAIYSQYPDAEISEVEDYVSDAPDSYPDKDYDLWGSEFLLTANQALPIRVYKEFEHQFGEPETLYRDPMASLMDLMSSLKKGEQLWYQIIVKPTGFEWVKTFEKESGRIIGDKPGPTLFSVVSGHVTDIFSAGMGKELEPPKKPEPPSMMNLRPRQKKQIEGIQNKINKIGFEAKIRMIYLAKKEMMNKPKVVNGFVGYMKQFAANDMNGFKPDAPKTATSTAYFQAEARANVRKNKIMRAYKWRSSWLGRVPFLLSNEELATIWHFPIDAVVKAPLVQRAAARRVEPPMRLPVGESRPTVNYESIFNDEEVSFPPNVEKQSPQTKSSFEDFLSEEKERPKVQRDQAPDNLPFV
jgi:hypothetical protein